MYTLLRGHTSPETAVVVEDYPYGRTLRCKIRYWVETATKGAGRGQSRFCRQTTNPKAGNGWTNKPKCGTYCERVYLYRDERNGHIEYASLHYAWPEHYAKFVALGLIPQMTEEEKADLDKYIADCRRLSPSTWVEFENQLAAVRKGMETGTLDTDSETKFMYGPTRNCILAYIKAIDKSEYTFPPAKGEGEE